ncbi:MAG: DNA translocase FtsK 4TM domain-containing protein [candidate division WOR-3 bacterium]
MKNNNRKIKKEKKPYLITTLLFLFSLYLFLSILSFYFFNGNIKEKNFCGIIGYYLSEFFLKVFGLLSWSVIFILFLIGFAISFKRKEYKNKLIKIIIFILSFSLIILQFFTLTLGRIDYYLSGINWELCNLLVNLFGITGSYILIIGVFLILIIALTGEKFISLLKFLLFQVRKLVEFITKNVKKFIIIKKEKAKKREIEEVPEIKKTEKITTEEIEKEDKILKERKKEKILIKDEFQKEFLSLLTSPKEEQGKDEKELKEEAEILLNKLKEFDITGNIVSYVTGPVITRFEFQPAPGIKIQKIESLADDLALSLKAERIRILAPIPGKSAVGIEIPNKKRRIVYLKEVLASQVFQSSLSALTFALGETITGEPYFADLREMPHILIAGTTGSGKSVCINSIISSIIFHSDYHDVRFLTIDPKQLELPIYDPIPHLLSPTTIDPKVAIEQLDRIILIMEERYGEFARLGVRDIEGFNQKAQELSLPKKPYIVVVIDELADLMLRAPVEIEQKITRLAQMSRAVGIHLILATQRPSVDVITGLIKANFPCRVAFQVASKTDSRTILDMNGAESLLGKGDMLFLPPGKGDPIRLHGAFISVEETKRIVNLWTKKYLEELLSPFFDNPEEKALEILRKEAYDILINKEKASIEEERKKISQIVGEEVLEKLLAIPYHQPLSEEEIIEKKKEKRLEGKLRELDELFFEAAKIVFMAREASVSMLQRKLDIGWARAGRIIDQLEQAGIVGPFVGSKSRRVLVETEEELNKILNSLRRI